MSRWASWIIQHLVASSRYDSDSFSKPSLILINFTASFSCTWPTTSFCAITNEFSAWTNCISNCWTSGVTLPRLVAFLNSFFIFVAFISHAVTWAFAWSKRCSPSRIIENWEINAFKLSVKSFWTSVHRALSSESWAKVSWIARFSSLEDHFNISRDAVFWAVAKAFAVDLTSRSCEITIFSSWWPLLIDFNFTPLLLRTLLALSILVELNVRSMTQITHKRQAWICLQLWYSHSLRTWHHIWFLIFHNIQ